MIAYFKNLYLFFKRQDPRGVIGRTLIFLILINFIFKNQDDIMVKSFLSFATAILLDLFFIKKEFGRYLFPYSAIVTASLVVLILDSKAPAWHFVLASALAILAKQFLQVGKKHIFNPAGFGLVLTSLLLGTKITWWGVSWNLYAPLILAIGAGAVLYSLNRLFLPIGFFIIYLLALLLMGALNTFWLFWDSTLFLFALVMLPEIKTSPVLGYFRYGFGILVASLFLILNKFSAFLPTDLLILSLLVANLLSFIIINFRKYLS